MLPSIHEQTTTTQAKDIYAESEKEHSFVLLEKIASYWLRWHSSNNKADSTYCARCFPLPKRLDWLCVTSWQTLSGFVL
jgi:hypothetical protein